MSHCVTLFVIDGLRPDALALAPTPTLHGLMQRGAYTLGARTVMPSVTLPCHVSLFTSVEPARHGITTNLYTPPARPVPSLFEVAHAAGLKTGSFYNWEELRDLARPGSLDVAIHLDNCHDAEGVGDGELAELAAQRLRRQPLGLTFVYLGYVDIAGHDHGWMSAPYLRGVANADRCIAHVLESLPPDASVIVTSDHGGRGRSHGTDDDADMTIPVILAGGGVPPLGALPLGASPRTVSILDIAPTIARLLGLAAPAAWEGASLVG
ncbi:MAG: alkaline phosphatase family protein [Chloroflexota bacterium]